ncbi:hypothetical protein K0M31_020469 [Melipona bicolor]|uniref:Uncharacterized protein n=1 Tax=Melipona bicolor TaxID=60889 RepID=A0AA40FCC8_9HYME|nr:hypothetical protein K0M31_020482 [Melipona bicolor]KAK1116379.1 hypothetical protein K0M31_020469 [Melipona bicolor]
MDWLRPDTVSVPSCSRPGVRGSAACAETTRQAPTRAVDRHTTGRDVLLGEKCTTTTPERSIRRWRALANGTTGAHPEHRAPTVASAVDDESPHSIFWVSQVYP